MAEAHDRTHPLTVDLFGRYVHREHVVLVDDVVGDRFEVVRTLTFGQQDDPYLLPVGRHLVHVVARTLERLSQVCLQFAHNATVRWPVV